MTIVVCAILRDENGRYLCGLRPQGKVMPGVWEFPGGKVEPGESPESAIIRELREELAIDVEVGDALMPVDWHDKRVRIRLLPYFCRITSGVPQAIEHEQLRWCAVEDFTSLTWADADVPILDQIRAMPE